jgi:hypothetical protein
MTAVTTVAPADVRSNEALRRIAAVTRLHFVNKLQIVGMPLVILVGILLINISIWLIILNAVSEHARKTTEHGFGYTGSIFYIYVYAVIIGVQAISRTFPFSLGFGVTRRDFYLGSVLAFVFLSVIFSVVMTVLSAIEDLTNGWGLGGHMLNPVYFHAGPWGLRFLLYFVVFLFVFFTGSCVASVYVRWKSTGLIAFFAVLVVILLAAAVIITLTDGWGATGAWFARSGSLGVALWSLIPSALAAVAGFFLLRRATPKN